MKTLLAGYSVGMILALVICTITDFDPSNRTVLASITIWGVALYFKDEDKE